MAGQSEKDVFERRILGAEVDHVYAMFAEAPDHLGHELIAASAHGDLLALTADRADGRDRLKVPAGLRVSGRDDDRALGTVPAHELGGRADVDDTPVIEDRDAVAQPLGLLHEVRRQEDRLAAVPDAAHQIPDRPSRLRVQTRRQLVEEHELGVVDERERDEQPLLLTARQGHEPGVALVTQAQLVQKTIAID